MVTGEYYHAEVTVTLNITSHHFTISRSVYFQPLRLQHLGALLRLAFGTKMDAKYAKKTSSKPQMIFDAC